MTEYSDTYWNKLLEQYQSGTISKEDRFKLEKRAMDDPFLFDALEGFSILDNDELDKKSSGRLLTIPRMAAAASLVFLVAMIFVLKNDTKPVASDKETTVLVLNEQNKGGDETEKEVTTIERSKEKTEDQEVRPSIRNEKNKANPSPTPAPTSKRKKPTQTEENKRPKENIATSTTQKDQDMNTEVHTSSSTAASEEITKEEDIVVIPEGSAQFDATPTAAKINVPTHTSEELADLENTINLEKSKKETKEERPNTFYKVEPVIGKKDFEDYVKESIDNRGLRQNSPHEVTIEFNIDEAGMLSDFLHVYNGCSECGAYAIYLLSGSGVWKTIPEGQAGRARYTLEF